VTCSDFTVTDTSASGRFRAHKIVYKLENFLKTHTKATHKPLSTAMKRINSFKTLSKLSGRPWSPVRSRSSGTLSRSKSTSSLPAVLEASRASDKQTQGVEAQPKAEGRRIEIFQAGNALIRVLKKVFMIHFPHTTTYTRGLTA
jgi:hypothetical protein